MFVKEAKPKSIFSTVVPRKGISETDVAITFILDCVADLGLAHHTVYLKNDQEPAIQSVIQGVVRGRVAPTVLEESPVGSSQSNGSIEGAVGEAEAQIRTARLALEQNYLHKIPIDHAIVPWMVKHCSFALNRFLIGSDGKSAYERIRGRPFKSDVLEFGETVYYKKPKTTIGPGLNKWDSRWGVGVLLGVRTVSGEQFVGTRDGTFKVRIVRRVIAKNRFDVDLLNTIKGSPWDLIGSQVPELPAEPQLQPIPADSIPRPIYCQERRVQRREIFKYTRKT